MALTSDQLAEAARRRRKGENYRQIARYLGVESWQVRRALIPREVGRTHSVVEGRGGYVGRHIPADVLAERERLIACRNFLTPAQEILGDPLPGRSALDQKRLTRGE